MIQIIKPNIIFIGIDPGVNTGIAIYNKSTRKLEDIRTLQLHEAFELVLSYKSMINLVRIEDSRLGDWFGTRHRDKLQGAGSIKRDCKAWDDFLTDKEIPFVKVKPGASKTKMHEKYFKQLTGWDKRTSNHARDAAMLVWGI